MLLVKKTLNYFIFSFKTKKSLNNREIKTHERNFVVYTAKKNTLYIRLFHFLLIKLLSFDINIKW